MSDLEKLEVINRAKEMPEEEQILTVKGIHWKKFRSTGKSAQ